MLDYKYPIISETVNGKKLTILGVEHDLEFFNRYKPLFEDFVRDNDAIVLEQGLEQGFRYDFWQNDFFGSIGGLVKEQGKRVYQVDPIGWGNVLLDLGTTTAAEALIYISVRGLKSQEKTTRRNLLKRMGQFALGIYLLMGSLPVRLLQSRLAPNTSVSYGVDDILEYGSTDYRNIVIAEGLDRICQEVENVNRIGSIHGAAHSGAVHKYLLSKKKRLKRLAYFPYDILGNTKIREYTPTSNGWRLSRTF